MLLERAARLGDAEGAATTSTPADGRGRITFGRTAWPDGNLAPGTAVLQHP
jgi:hypothetical protein